MSEKHVYAALTRKISILLVVVSLTPLYLLSALVAYQFHTSYQAKVMAHLREMVTKHRQSIDSFLQERLANIRVLLEAGSLEHLSNHNDLNELLSTLQIRYSGDFVDIGLVDANGTQVAYAGPYKLEEVNYSNADWFQHAMRNEYFISNVFLGMRRQPHFIVAARRTWKGNDYILRATIDFESFNRLVEQLHIGETGLAFIVGRDGSFQTKPRIDLSSCSLNILQLIKSSLGDRWNEEPHLATNRASFCDGHEAIFVMATLKQGDWVLVYRQIAADAFSDLYETRYVAILLLIVGTGAMLYTARFLSRRMVASIEKLDADKEAMNAKVIEASKMVSLGEMAAGIAHEINNPVAVMVEEAGWVGDLLDDYEAGGGMDIREARRALHQVKNQGERCKGITQKLLSFARKGDPERRELNVNTVLREIMGLLDHKARLANVELACHLDEDVPPVTASSGELSQVIVNLVNNAIDAMEAKGGQIDLSSHRQSNCVEIRVRDNGPGIPEAILPRIFDPFFTTKPVGRGTGLGLAVCYGIIKNLGGDILVESAMGKGSLFRVLLPVAGLRGEFCLLKAGLNEQVQTTTAAPGEKGKSS